MSCLRLTLAVLFVTILAALPLRAQLVINELSNGTSGAQEYVELLVVGTPSCANPCVDLRGWVLDDNNGTFATGTGTGIAGGHMRFANDATWQCIPIGTIIVIYNNTDRNPGVPADNLTGANCVYVIPASSTLFERNTTQPSATGVATYAGPYVAGGDWATQGMSNTEDSYQTRAPGALTVPYHAVSYAGNNANTIIYFAGGGGGQVYSMTNGTSNDPFLQTNWTAASASTNQTPGAPNNTANATWIASLNNNCNPITSVVVDLGPDVSVCLGDSITIRATANVTGTFSWPGFPLNNTDSLRIAPTAPIGIIVNFNGGVGCTDADTIAINIIAPPTGGITGNTAICAGQSTTLSATGGGTYNWSTSETTTSITVSPITNTFYDVTVTNSGGCRDTVGISVTVNTQPVGQITGDNNICIGESTTLTASGGTSYEWSTTENTAAITVSPLITTPYSVTVVDVNGCRDSVFALVTVNAPPTVTISGNTAICAGDNTTLTASGGDTYVWSTTATTAAITVSPPTDASYTVTATDTNGCVGTATATVTVGAAVTAAITGDLTICQGESTTLTATGGTIFIWSTSETTNAITVSPTINTTYSVTVSSSPICFDVATVTVNIDAPTVGAIAGDLTICPGESTTLTASGGVSYLWSTAEVTAPITVSPITNTTYTVTVTGANGCLDTVTAVVTIDVAPVATAGPDTIICEGNPVVLTATGGGNYLWSTNETTNTITVTPSTNTTYTVTVTSANGCTATDGATVTVNANNIVLAVDNIAAETCEQVNGQITLQSPSNFVTYVLVENGARIDSVLGGGVFFDLDGGNYTIIATDNNGCQRTITNVLVPETLIPQATVTATTPTCFGDANGTITLTSSTTGLYYSLDGGTPQLSSTFSGLVGDDYQIRVIDSVAGCDNLIDFTLTQPDVLEVSVSPDSTNIVQGEQVELVSTVTGGTTPYSYLWVPSTALDCDTCATVTSTPQDSLTAYTLTVTDTNGCVDTARAVIRVTNEFLITVPSGFTPDGDGNNDFLRPLSNEPIDFTLMIFNRWGEKIYQGDGMPGWDGTYKYERQPIATYVYVIEYTRLLNGDTGYLTGSFTLLR